MFTPIGRNIHQLFETSGLFWCFISAYRKFWHDTKKITKMEKKDNDIGGVQKDKNKALGSFFVGFALILGGGTILMTLLSGTFWKNCNENGIAFIFVACALAVIWRNQRKKRGIQS